MVEVRTRGWAAWVGRGNHRQEASPDAPAKHFLQKLQPYAEIQQRAGSESKCSGAPVCVHVAFRTSPARLIFQATEGLKTSVFDPHMDVV